MLRLRCLSCALLLLWVLPRGEPFQSGFKAFAVPTRLASKAFESDKFVPSEHWERMESILLESDLMPSTGAAGMHVEKLSAGFCNAVYKCDVDGRSPGGTPMSFVVKLFSKLAELRVDPAQSAAVDEMAGRLQIAAHLYYRNRFGLCHEMLPGKTLTEEDIHGMDGRPSVVLEIARPIALLHTSPIPEEFCQAGSSLRSTILQMAMEKMLAHVALRSAEGRHPPEGLEYDRLANAVRRTRDTLDQIDLPLVLGHGDLKPSNVVWTAPRSPKFIDFELSGPNFRGFDLFKLFRTNTKEAFRYDLFQKFLRVYLQETKHLTKMPTSISEADMELLTTEVVMFEPVTWLEAALFFVFAYAEDPNPRWAELAIHRWERYLEKEHVLEEKAKTLVQIQAGMRVPQ